ncbi:MAG: rod shape-determining protein MreC [Acidimicrobiia bacterium]
MNREPRGHTLPLLVTLIILGVLLMTFDVRLQGGGVVGVLRTGTQTIIAPVQQAASYAVNPVADMIDSLSNLSNLREENIILRRELAEAEASLVGVRDQLARLEHFEQLYRMEAAGDEIGRTVANVIGRPDAFDAALIIDKGTSDGLVVGQPVVDTNGHVVGTVKSVTRGSATIVPITADRQALTVIVGDQIGSLLSQVATDEMRLEILTAREPVLVGDEVLTSAVSASFPAGLPVGVVIEDAVPSNDVLSTKVDLFVNPDTLRLVVVLAWPPDPITASSGETLLPGGTSTTTTTIEGDGS